MYLNKEAPEKEASWRKMLEKQPYSSAPFFCFPKLPYLGGDNGLETYYGWCCDPSFCFLDLVSYSISVLKYQLWNSNQGQMCKPRGSPFKATLTQTSSLLTIILFTHCISETIRVSEWNLSHNLCESLCNLCSHMSIHSSFFSKAVFFSTFI